MLLFLYFCKPGKPGETGKPGVLLHFSVTRSSRVVISFRKNSFGQLQFRFLLQFYLSFFHPVVHSLYQVVKRDNTRRIFTTFFLLSSSLRSNSHSNSFFHPARIHFLLQFHFTLSKNVVNPQKKCPSHSKARQRRHCRAPYNVVSRLVPACAPRTTLSAGLYQPARLVQRLPAGLYQPALPPRNQPCGCHRNKPAPPASLQPVAAARPRQAQLPWANSGSLLASSRVPR